jgi:F-type H+-transporting ATPase subunit b
MPQFDTSSYPSQIFWLLLCVGFLFFFIKYIFVPRMNLILKKRQETIDEYLNQSEKMTDKKIETLREYEKELGKNREKAMLAREKQLKNFEEKKEKKIAILREDFIKNRDFFQNNEFFDINVQTRFQDVLLKK